MAWQRKTPFGYTIQNGETMVSPQEADVVRSIFTHYLAGVSYAKIAEELSKGSVPYHQHTARWNKHMVKRILENGKYLGTDVYPRLVSDADFLAVQLQQKEKNTYAPIPADLNPIRGKMVCAVCGGRLTRDTKSHGQARWVCGNPECRTVIRISDDELQERVTERLRQLAGTPSLLTLPDTPEVSVSPDALRIQNEINLCFNRAGINSEYMKTLIFAVAAERYAALQDPTPAHDLTALRGRLESLPTEADLRELLDKAVAKIRLGAQGEIGLELVNGKIVKKSSGMKSRGD